MFLYDLPDATLYAPGTLACLQGQWGTEVLTRWFFRHTCRGSYSDADWYFVAVYGTCRYVALNEELVANATAAASASETSYGKNYTSEADVLPDMDVVSDSFIYSRVLDYLRGQRAWARREGRDHIFLF